MRVDSRILLVLILALLPVVFVAESVPRASSRAATRANGLFNEPFRTDIPPPPSTGLRLTALPFPDNPDPTQCGIPVAWSGTDPAWISGIWQGELIAPVVDLYDSHLRRAVTGQLPHGSRVEIELSQANPVLDYYRVRSIGVEPIQQGWVPGPFVSFGEP